MDQDILLSKIVSNATDNTWSQAYTTINVYITLSIENEKSTTPVTPYGKSLLEKLQREFFALDEKTLDNIKLAVSNVVKTIEEDYKYSIIVGALSGNTLYIVIASLGQVIIKRGDKFGVVATGIEGEMHGFSGKLKHDDVIFLQTGDFSKKLTPDSLPKTITSNEVLQIAEDITPLIHEGSRGTESAIILQYKSHSENSPSYDTVNENLTQEPTPPNEKDDDAENTQEEESYKENLWTKPPKENLQNEDIEEQESVQNEKAPKRLKLSIPKLKLGKRTIIAGIIILLILILIGGIYYQTTNSNNTKKDTEFSKIYDPIQSRYEEALEYEKLNQTLALEELNETLKIITSTMNNYDKNSSEYKKLEDLKSQIESKISEIGGGGGAQNVKEFLKAGKELSSIRWVTAKGGSLIVLDSKGEKVATIKEDGAIDDTFDIKTTADFISADDKSIFVMGKTLTKIDRGNGNVSEITDDINGDSFDIFGTNVYTLTGEDILKYVPPSYSGASYFKDKAEFNSKPVDMSIAGPIFILESDGSIESFTKGIKDDFKISGLSAPIGEGGKIYADSELDNIYVMDVKNQRVVVLSEEGDFIKQYEGSFIKGAISFAIDEENSTGYVLNSDTVYSFDL